jgi:hypothetical protein
MSGVNPASLARREDDDRQDKGFTSARVVNPRRFSDRTAKTSQHTGSAPAPARAVAAPTATASIIERKSH